MTPATYLVLGSARKDDDVARSRAGRRWLPARLVLLGLLIPGLVGMHQLPGSSDCCAASAVVGGTPVSLETVHQALTSATTSSGPSRPSTSHVAAAAVVSPVDAAPVSVLNLLGMCLALLGAVGGLLAAVVLAWWGHPTRTDGAARAASGAAAEPRAPPTRRHLARLQVLRL